MATNLKMAGGLGLKDLQIGKEVWELLQNQNLYAKFFRAMYYPRDNYLLAKVTPHASHIFRDLIHI